MNIEKWLIAGCLVFASLFVQADTQPEQLELAKTYSEQVVQLFQQGLFKQALPLAENAYNIRKQILGEKHHDTLASLNNLASIYLELGRFSEALPLSEKAYSLAKNELGEKHPLTLAGLNNLAGIYLKLGRFYQALPLFEKAYSISKEVLGEKHQDTLVSLNNLAGIYLKLGRFYQALPLFEKAYFLKKDVLGEKHPDTLHILNNLAVTYGYLGHFSEALPLFEKAYFLKKDVLGEKHPDTLQSLNNLAVIYRYLGRFSEALPLSDKAYSLRKEVLGEKHPDTLQSLNNLAGIYQNLGRFSEALPLSDKAYSLRKDVLGEKHPATLRSLNNLAQLYSDLGRFSEALPLSDKAYSLRKDVLGEKHPDTLVSLNNLAGIYSDLGRFSQALPLYEKAYSLRKDVLGEKHPDTLQSLNNLAVIYRYLGRFSEALPLSEKAYSLSKDVSGEKHPDTINSLNNLARLYSDLGRFSEALPLSDKAYSLSKDVLGEKHPDTLASLNNLAQLYSDLGRFSEALPLSEKAYSLSKDVLGEKHPDTLASLNNLVGIYSDLGRFSEALPLFEKAYSLRKEVLGEKHPDTLVSLNNLAGIYSDLGRFYQALPLFEKAYSLRKEVLGEKHPNTLNSLLNLAGIYRDLGRFSEALPLSEKYVSGVESLRRGDLSAENRQALFKKWVPSYFMLSSLYIGQSRHQEAFRLAEMSKARTLLESLAAKLAAQQSGLLATEQQQLQDYEARLAFLSDRIAKALENNRLEEKISLEAEKNQLVSQLNQFDQELKAKYPKYAKLSEVQIIGAKEGAKYLPADAVLISYLVLENFVLAFTLQADGTLTAHDLGEIPALDDDLVTDYRDQLFAPTIEQGTEPTGHPEFVLHFGSQPEKEPSLSLQLGQQLLGPLYDVIKDKKHWIISPSGPLALIPFETLRVDGDEPPPVIAKHQISYVQSLSVLKLLQERGTVYNSLSNRGDLFAMGAPLYQDSRVGTGDPSPIDFNIASRLLMRGGDYARAFRQLGRDNWTMLPGTLTELDELETLFKDTKPLIYKQADATEAKLQDLNQQHRLAQYRYLVFSAHGYLSPQVPALSSIVLGQVNNPPGIDGYVTAGEWPGYDLKSDLMVLSACETGLGEVVSGEGVMGLPYAFYVAGNKNTILTLWKISDDVTVEFIKSFFTKLKAGVGQIEALTATKREFLNQGGRYRNPKYWAAFVLYGV